VPCGQLSCRFDQMRWTTAGLSGDPKTPAPPIGPWIQPQNDPPAVCPRQPAPEPAIAYRTAVTANFSPKPQHARPLIGLSPGDQLEEALNPALGDAMSTWRCVMLSDIKLQKIERLAKRNGLVKPPLCSPPGRRCSDIDIAIALRSPKTNANMYYL
jgi:hypothetical protein